MHRTVVWQFSNFLSVSKFHLSLSLLLLIQPNNPSLPRYCVLTVIDSFKNKTNILCESQRTGNELKRLTPKLWIASKATFHGFAKQNLVWTSNLLAAVADGLQIVYPSLSPPWVMFSVRKKPFISIHLTLFFLMLVRCLCAFSQLIS